MIPFWLTIFKRSTDRLLWPGLTGNYDPAGRGKRLYAPSSEDIANALAEHIAEMSLLLCGGAASYNYLAEKTNCEKIPLVGHESYNKVYHLNTVNNLHSRLKEMLRTFRGVATKYLNRYAALFALIAMSVELSVAEAADRVRRTLQNLRLPVTIKSAKVMNILAI